MIDTGRRPAEVCALDWDCLARDADGTPVLVYDNSKAHRQRRRLPVSEHTAALITVQKTAVRERFPDTPPARLRLLPSRRLNPDGTRPVTEDNLTGRHRIWVDSMGPLLRADGTEYGKSLITPYSYRHSYAQRHADAGVGIDVLRELMDHESMDTTKRYYRVGEARRREAVDKVTAMQFDRHGNRIWRNALALLGSERARYAVGSVAVPYGTCTEPANVQAGGGACPIRFRCAGCDHFRIRSACCTRLCCQCEGRVWWTSGGCSGSVAALRRKPRPAMRRLGGRVLLTVSAGWGSGSGSRS